MAQRIIGAKAPAKTARPTAAPAVTHVTVGEEGEGQRLDNYLVKTLKGVPKTLVYRIIRSGEVRVNKGRAQADTRLEAGDVVRLPPVRISERAGQKADAMAREIARHGASSTTGGYAPSREFPILFEDDFVLAIDKPAGVAVHGGSGVSFGVIEQLRMARPDADFLELVHRLDRETSGILLIAKRRMALKLLQEQFRERETDKVYLALVSGDWPAKHRVIDKALHKYLLADGERRVKVVENDLILDPERLLPPPRMKGQVTAVRIEGDRIIQPFGTNGRNLTPSYKADHYMYYQGGELSFGKTTMHGADLKIIDADPKDPFDFFLAQYAKQLTAGYSRTLANKGLVVYMPDSDEAEGRRLVP